MDRPNHPEIAESERFPLLTPEGRRFLHAMRQDPQAPIWNWPNGEQLDASGLDRVERFAASLRSDTPAGPDHPPDWLEGFAAYCLAEVPFYRSRSRSGTRWEEIPSCSREDLAPRPWDFVPDSEPLDRLIVFSSSGTTGHPARLPTHPFTAACGLPLLEHALAPLGVSFPRGADRMALTNLTAYPGAYTTAIVIAWLREAGCIRVNLDPADWRSGGDCAAYLDRWHAPIVLGDPVAFAALESLGLRRAPAALISSITALSPGYATELSTRFGCPVLDVYALTEAGIVAVGAAEGHLVLPPDLYVEILDGEDRPCAPGVRGEVTLTGGRNPFAPLLRYRTGDFAALERRNGRLFLIGLDGRRPVLFPTPDGRIVHSMEVSRALRRLPLVQFRLHQDAEGEFRFGWRGAVDGEEVRRVLQTLLGASAPLALEELPPPGPQGRKVREFESEVRIPLIDRLRGRGGSGV